MGLQIILHIHQADNVKFSDIDLLNTFLDKQGMGELYQEFTQGGLGIEGEDGSYFDGTFQLDDGKLYIAQRWDSDFQGYDTSTMIWGCFGEREMRTIARFLIGGKIVFHIDTEGNSDEWWVITPGRVKKKEPTF